MTFDEYYNLTDKYGIEVDADLWLSFRNYLLGRIQTDQTCEDPNRHLLLLPLITMGIRCDC